MKKRLKFILICSIICIAVGSVLTGASYQYAKKNYVPEYETYAHNFDINAIDNIVIKNAVASVYIERGERFGIVAENMPEDTLICEVSGNTLTISTEDWHHSFNFNVGFIKFPRFPSMEGASFMEWKREEIKIYLYIPESKDIQFEEIILKENVGNIKADYLSCRILEISKNVGTTTIDELNVGDFLLINGGVGNVNLKDGLVNGNTTIIGGRVGNTTMTATINGDVHVDGGVGNTTLNSTINGTVKINNGIGNVNLTGEVNGDITIDGGVGNTTLTLSGHPGDYSVSSDAGLGKVYYKNVRANNPNAKYDIIIDGGVGNINISID